ncbi:MULTISPECIES: GNAT family N-acetyltransferase [Thioclava]|uniref:GNAT family N-acetyltransferase n=1 Tax=Thioclava kandeliae TaxID=3070818 RepID=A0ABV1SG50_9RHOB
MRYCLPETFATDRYALRRVQPEDAPAIFEAYVQDPEVTRFVGWRPHGALADTRAYLANCGKEWDAGTGFPAVVFAKGAPGDLMGLFHPHLHRHRVTYGYVLRRSAWGQGCASEVLRWLVDHALSHPDIFRAEAFCDKDHTASARVMEKAGLRREGVLRRYFLHPNISDTPRDCWMYAKVR